MSGKQLPLVDFNFCVGEFVTQASQSRPLTAYKYREPLVILSRHSAPEPNSRLTKFFNHFIPFDFI
jgi:hypothetical protein